MDELNIDFTKPTFYVFSKEEMQKTGKCAINLPIGSADCVVSSPTSEATTVYGSP